MVIVNKRDKFTSYDNKILEHVKKLNSMMLIDFIHFCEEYNIEYFLDGGTLLGAVRHGGFIPWDDDVDVIMFRDQHDKFVEIMKNNNSLNEKYEFVSFDTTDDYLRLYSQLMLRGTKTDEYYGLNCKFTVGLSLDIFIFDELPNSSFKMKMLVYKWKFYRTLAWLYELIYNDAYISKNKQRIGKVIGTFFKIIGINFKTVKKFGFKMIDYTRKQNSGKVFNFGTYYIFKPIEKKWFDSSKKAKFESLEASIPSDYDAYLTRIYGNYMQLPPIEERVNHMYNTVDFGPYKLD